MNNTIYIGALDTDTNIIKGFYTEGIHGKELCSEILANGGVPLSEELWQELLTYGQAKVNIDSLATIPMTVPEHGEFCFGMEHCGHFEKVEQVQEEVPHVPTQVDILEEKVLGLEEKIDKLLVLLDK